MSRPQNSSSFELDSLPLPLSKDGSALNSPDTNKEALSQLLLSDFLQTTPGTGRNAFAARQVAYQEAAVSQEGFNALAGNDANPPEDGDKPPVAQEPESIAIDGKQVKIKSAQVNLDKSRTIVIAEDYGVHPAGTKITYFDRETFPDGQPSKYGKLLAVAEHPGGNKVYTKRDGNTVYDLTTSVKTNYPGGAFESKFFEELPNGTQLWRTTNGVMVERHAEGSLSTSMGKIARIDLKDGTLTYLTENSKTYQLKEANGKLTLSEIENGVVKSTTNPKSLTETFDPAYNHPFYGAVASRTRSPGQITLDLGDRGSATIYTTQPKYDANRTISTVVEAKDKTTQTFLNDGSVVHTRPAALAAGDRDWVKIDSRANEQSVFYKNGDFITKKPDGTRIEGYAKGHTTSLDGKVTQVERLKDKNVYRLDDGGKVELPLKGGPLVKTKADGSTAILKENSVKEHFPNGQPTAFGPVSLIETQSNGDLTYTMSNHKDFAKVTLLGTPRYGFKGYAEYKDGSMRMINPLGAVIDTPLNANNVSDLLSGASRLRR